MRKISCMVLVLVLVLVLALSGTAFAAEKLKVVLVLPGKMDDLSWNQSMYEGMKNLEAEFADKADFAYVEEVYDVAAIEPALRDFASEGYDVIFGHGFQFMEPILKVAAEFPNAMFALGTGFKSAQNTCIYDVKLDEGGYLMGVLAAHMTKTNKIGVLGGVDVSEIYRGHEAFKLAAKTVKPDIEIQEYYTGDWRDAAKAKEGALSMYDSGVDIMWHSGDGIGVGAVNAAKEKNKYILGNISDQYVLAPASLVSGTLYNWTSVIRQILNDILNDNFTNRENKSYWLTVPNEGIKLAPYHDFEEIVTPEIKAEVEKTIKALHDGTLKIPHFEK
ncbi:MAG: BMP family protein [Synergistaceae bacterium]|nr:BMP family protein [Synergistaceae bacterium]